MRRLDLPPLWLLLYAILAWVLSRLGLGTPVLRGAWVDLAAGLLLGGGAALIFGATLQMRRHRTPVVPRRTPTHLMSTGLFRWSRNPIYLGMALALLGWVLLLGEPFALPLVPLFGWVIQRRFIAGEEARLARRFSPDWGRYARATRRWL